MVIRVSPEPTIGSIIQAAMRGDMQSPDNGQTMNETLQTLNREMNYKAGSPIPDRRPKVMMEPGMGERSYPQTDKYNYIPNPHPLTEGDMKQLEDISPPPGGSGEEMSGLPTELLQLLQEYEYENAKKQGTWKKEMTPPPARRLQDI